MFGDIGPRMKGGLTRLQQQVSSGLTHVVVGPLDAAWQFVAGATRSITVSGGDAGALGTSGGSAAISGGAGSNTGAGGGVSLTGGVGGSGAGGSISIVSGAGGSTGGAIDITASETFANGNGAQITITGGRAGSSSGGGGKVRIVGGASPSSPTVGGAIELVGGASAGSQGCNVLIQPGSGSTYKGNICLDAGVGAAISTAATGGFVTVPTCAGAPSGVPASVPTGSVATVVDTTNLRVYYYISGTWRYATLT